MRARRLALLAGLVGVATVTGLLWRRSTSQRVLPPGQVRPQFACGVGHILLLGPDGGLWGWGWNASGTIGSGTNQGWIPPTRLAGGRQWVAVAAGARHSLALRADGTLWAWGDNSVGQLGDGTGLNRDAPRQIGADRDWVQIAAAWNHSLGLKADGTLWGWGESYDGQLGPRASQLPRPERTSPDAGWRAVATGLLSAVALKRDGTLWEIGGLGPAFSSNPGTETRAEFRPLGRDSNWVAVAAGPLHALALKRDGTLWGWGQSAWAAAHDAAYANALFPAQIGQATNWQAVAAGWDHCLAQGTDGALWAWGGSGPGDLGVGIQRRDVPAPTRVIIAPRWRAFAAGPKYSVGLTEHGAVMVWGKFTPPAARVAGWRAWLQAATARLGLTKARASTAAAPGVWRVFELPRD